MATAADLAKGRDSKLTVTNAVKASRKARERYERFWKRYRNEITGTYYRQGEGTKRFTNFLYMYASTFLPELVARDPEIVVRARREYSDWQMSEILRLGINAVIRRTNFTDELRLAVHDSLWGFGIMKTGMTPTGDPDAGHQYGDDSFMDPMMPFAERISPWNFLWDDDAKDFKRCSHMGHEFTRELDVFVQQMKDGIYDRVKPDEITTLDAYATDWERVDLFEKYHESGVDVPPQVRLVEYYVAPTRTLYTLLEESKDKFRVVRKVPAFCPPNGPYHMLGFLNVPDRVVPLAPTAAWFDQYVEHEVHERKMNEQAQSEKRMVNYPQELAENAKKAAKAPDQHIIIGGEGATNIHWGGVTEERMAYAQHARRSLEFMSGLNDVRMGIGGDSKTATEATMLDQNANVRVADMRRSVARFAQEVLGDIRWYIWNSEAFQIDTTTYSPEGLPAEVRIQGGTAPDDERDESDFAVEIEPDSLYMDNASARRARAAQDAQLILGPFRMFLMEQGYMLDAGAFARWYAQNGDMPYLEDMVIPASPQAMEMWQMSLANQQQRGQIARQMTDGGGGGVQSRIMTSEVTNGAISQATSAASPMRVANTDPRAYNP